MTKKFRCAIYTRKSTEDGLEQDFNSLDAQREACEAYIKSQKHEGWELLTDSYDDGGISGSTMSRPALSQLLADVSLKRIDIIVVYKVDRLTRTLSDFAKMVDIFEKNTVSFISITQQFNTTTSMGRLTLNVLLSFSQFEREITAERIRDKIAASKKKGMWMGGQVPLGYEALEKKLVVNKDAAKIVKTLYQLYLKLGNVRSLKDMSDQLGIKTKICIYKSGHQTGGKYFSQSHLYKLLKNPTYIGKVLHKGQLYDGVHEAIIDQPLWDRVQTLLKNNSSKRVHRTNFKSPNLLTGLLYDADNRYLTPSHTCKGSKRYRYYISAARNKEKTHLVWRLPAIELENIILDGLTKFLSDSRQLTNQVINASISPASAQVIIAQATLVAMQIINGSKNDKKIILQELIHSIKIFQTGIKVYMNLGYIIKLASCASEIKISKNKIPETVINIPAILQHKSYGKKFIMPAPNRYSHKHDQQLIRAIALAHVWFSGIKCGKSSSLTDLAKQYGVERTDAGRFLKLAFLAPDIIEAIAQGSQPSHLTFRMMKRLTHLPSSWVQQRKLLGFKY